MPDPTPIAPWPRRRGCASTPPNPAPRRCWSRRVRRCKPINRRRTCRRGGRGGVQLGAFDNPATADGLKTRVFAAGFPAYTDTIRVASGTLWRVRVGPEASRDGALALRAQIKAKLGQDGIVAVAH
ncbi:SPOR domain-containing protein [Metallibacterium sp.]|uniref:SPOR domain-containing protein n=1 Tax=Metallibacterium sp. TaxID=2940281 RepID=UPI002631B618|nr:SPOR domain-containing protein [Metallibacterium sp.]